jgi:RNA polymerase sigma factor (sigma-70 family)
VVFVPFADLRVCGAMVEGLGQAGPHTRGFLRRRSGRADRPAPPPPCSFDDTRPHGTGRRELAEALTEALDCARLAPRLCRALAELDPTSRTLIERHYFAGESLQEIGHGLGISRSWASRMHVRALAHLRAALDRDRPPVTTA